jgi:hypothetical protein
LLLGLAISLKNNDEYDRAAVELSRMSDLFPGDYRVPMHRARLEMLMQSEVEIDRRNYSLTKEYYELAVRLYNENIRPGESDPEMQQLSFLIEQLKDHGWID